MDGKTYRKLFIKARRIAAQFAERCDFVVAERIKKEGACCNSSGIIAGVTYKGNIERTQIVTAYTYAAGLLGLDFYVHRDEDGSADDGRKYVLINLDKEPPTEEK